MINLLATGLVSLCLLSPVQSPDCTGDIGVSTPIVSAHVSVLPKNILPIPFPPIPSVSFPPVPLPVKPPVHLPEPPPVHPPHPVPGPEGGNPIHLPAPAAPVPEQAPPALSPAPAEVPKPVPFFTPPAIQQPPASTPSPTPVASPPVTQKAPTHYRPPFNDGSFGAAIGNTAAQFPDLLWVFTILLGVGIVALVERLDESPKLQSIFRKKQ